MVGTRNDRRGSRRGAAADPAEALDSALAWRVVGAAFLATFTVFGVTYAFASFFTSMAAEFGTGRGATALMFSLTTALYFGIGPFTGRIADRAGPKPMLVAAAVALGVGLLATSRVNSIWLGYLTYGVGVGVAVACAYVPMVSTVGAWFVRRRTAALGVSVAGIGMGTLILAPLSARLIDAFGWRTAYVVLAIGGVGALLVAALLARRPPVTVDQGPVEMRKVMRSRNFVVLYAASLLVTVPLFVPFVFIKSYAEERGIDTGLAAALVGFIGAFSIIGRLGLGALGARVGSIRLMQISFGILAGSFLLWLAAGSSYAMLVAFTIVMGVGYGGFIALAPAVTAALFGTRGLGGILGALYTGAGIGGLIGPPLAGEVIDRASYGLAIGLCSAVAAISTVVLFALPRE